MTAHGPNALWELTKERDELKALLATCERVADEFRRQDDERHAAIIAERDALKAAVGRVRQEIAEEMAKPYAMTNAEMEDLRDLSDDEYHERCGEVYRRYFLRIARGAP